MFFSAFPWGIGWVCLYWPVIAYNYDLSCKSSKFQKTMRIWAFTCIFLQCLLATFVKGL